MSLLKGTRTTVDSGIVLLIDDEPNALPRKLIRLGMPEYGYNLAATTYEDGIKALQENRVALLLLDHDLAESMDGEDVMKWLEQNLDHLPDEIISVSMNPVGRNEINNAAYRLYERASKGG